MDLSNCRSFSTSIAPSTVVFHRVATLNNHRVRCRNYTSMYQTDTFDVIDCDSCCYLMHLRELSQTAMNMKVAFDRNEQMKLEQVHSINRSFKGYYN